MPGEKAEFNVDTKEKKCTGCQRWLHYLEYWRAPRGRFGRHSRCKDCHRKYEASPRTRKARKDALWKWQLDKRLKLWAYLKSHSCMDCCESDPLVLEFDHVRGSKVAHIALLLDRSSWQDIETEIGKCEVVCSNCHQRRTHKRAFTWRQRFLEQQL